MKMKMFVIRQLNKDCMPVVTGVVEMDTNDYNDHSSAKKYLNLRADEIIRNFTEKFPDFAKANWYKQYVDGSSEYTELA